MNNTISECRVMLREGTVLIVNSQTNIEYDIFDPFNMNEWYSKYFFTMLKMYRDPGSGSLGCLYLLTPKHGTRVFDSEERVILGNYYKNKLT